MAFSDAGPATNVLAALATSIGFGLVVGGFVGGAISFVSTHSQKAAEKWTLIGGYFGAFAALVLLAIDIVMRSFV
jgi:hypothetical protein